MYQLTHETERLKMDTMLIMQTFILNALLNYYNIMIVIAGTGDADWSTRKRKAEPAVGDIKKRDRQPAERINCAVFHCNMKTRKLPENCLSCFGAVVRLKVSCRNKKLEDVHICSTHKNQISSTLAACAINPVRIQYFSLVLQYVTMHAHMNATDNDCFVSRNIHRQFNSIYLVVTNLPYG